jgi:hypothetical protein
MSRYTSHTGCAIVFFLHARTQQARPSGDDFDLNLEGTHFEYAGRRAFPDFSLSPFSRVLLGKYRNGASDYPMIVLSFNLLAPELFF